MNNADSPAMPLGDACLSSIMDLSEIAWLITMIELLGFADHVAWGHK